MEDGNIGPESATAMLPEERDAPPPAQAPASIDDSLEKVRDILFGVQIRDVDRRFVRLEEKMAREAADLRDDMRRRLTALELFVKSEIESLNSRLRAEHDTRTGVAAAFTRDLATLAATLERRAGTIDDQMDQRQRELRQQMLDQHQRLSDDLSRKAQDLLSALAREAGALRHAKADRATLAALLAEMAGRLTDGLDAGAAHE